MKRLILLAAATAAFRLSAQPTFSAYSTIAVSSTWADHLAVGDLDNDGKPDVVAVSGFSFGINDYKLFVFHNTGSALGSTPTLYNYRPVYPGARAVAAGDVNGDGLCDVVIGFGDSLGIFTQNFLGVLNAQTSYQCDPGAYTDAIKICDLDQDGHKDIVCLSWGGQAVVFYGNGSGSFTKVSYSSAATAGYDDLKVGIIGADSLVSIVEMGGQSHAPIHQVRIHSNRTVASTTTLILGVTDNMHGAAIGNFSDTAHKQIAATFGGNVPTSKLAFWRNPTAVTTADTIVSVSDIPQAMAAGKFDCYNRDYAAILHGGWNKVSLIGLGTGGGVSTYTVGCPNNASPDAIAIVDVNGDGKNDIVTVNSYAGISVLMNTSRLYDTTITTTASCTVDSVRSATSFARHDTVFVIKTLTIDTNWVHDTTRVIAGHCSGSTISSGTTAHLDTTHHTVIDTSAVLTVKKHSAYGDQVVSGAVTGFKTSAWDIQNISLSDTLITWMFYVSVDTVAPCANVKLKVSTAYCGITSGGNPIANTTGGYIPFYPGVTVAVEQYADFTIGNPGHGFRPSLALFAKDLTAKISLATSASVSGQRMSN